MKALPPKILIVEDHEDLIEDLEYALSAEGYEVVCAKTGPEGKDLIDNNVFELVISDYKLPEIYGDVLLQHVRRVSPYTATILITAYGKIDHAVEMLHDGIDDYVTKPFLLKEIKARIIRLLERRELRRQIDVMQQQLQKFTTDEIIIGKSPAIQQVLQQVAMVSMIDVPVVIEGDSGVGKELVARAIHYSGVRKSKPFIPINCGALPDALLESELFGHVKGAFTGADKHKTGIFEEAAGGTILLDEVTELNLNTQVKLLRTQQEKEIRRVGSTRPVYIDVRFIAATNKSLSGEVEADRFRKDLYYRLNVITIRVPTLNERGSDIPILAQHFLQKYAQKFDKPVKDYSTEAMRKLANGQWPGNIRELENVIQKAILMTRTSAIAAEDLDIAAYFEEFLPYKKAKERFDRQYLAQALQESEGNARLAAKKAGMHWKNFWEKLKKYNLTVKNAKQVDKGEE